MRLDYVSRDSWGAKYAAGSGARDLPTAEAWLHHTVTLAPDLAFTDLDGDSTDDDEAAAMRAVEAIGQQRFGAGFSYNLAVMPSGRVYVGCGVRRVGTHTGGRNTRALGVVLVGDYDMNPLPEAMRKALPDLLRDAHDEGWIDAPRFDGGHRDLKKTACPGRHAYAALPEINRDALGIEVAPALPTVPLEEDDMPPLVFPHDSKWWLFVDGRAVHIAGGMDDVRAFIALGAKDARSLLSEPTLAQLAGSK